MLFREVTAVPFVEDMEQGIHFVDKIQRPGNSRALKD
jgi:hypothetical protein